MSENWKTVKVQSHHMLVRLIKAPRERNGIHIPETRAALEDVATPMAEVVAQGPDCYMDFTTYPPKPRGTRSCKVGDTIIMPSYAGARVAVHDDEYDYRIVNDDACLAVVDDPTLIRRGE